MVDARGFALVHVDCTELRNRAGKGIDARRKWASQAGAELPGGESFHRAIAEQVYAGGIENRILHVGGWGKIHVTGANQFLAMNERVGNFGDDAVCGFVFHRGADLVNFRNAKIVREGGNAAAGQRQQVRRNGAGSCQGSAIDQGIRISRKNRLGISVGLVEKDRVGGEAVIGFDGRVIDVGIPRRSHARCIRPGGGVRRRTGVGCWWIARSESRWRSLPGRRWRRRCGGWRDKG